MSSGPAVGAAGEIVIACYRPKPGKDGELRELIAGHVPALRRLGLATARPVVLLRSAADGTYLEIFEWVSAGHATRAHHEPEIAALWKAMGECADFPPLGSLSEAARPFSHFQPVDGLTG